MDIPQGPNRNHLLAALPTAEFQRIAPHLESVAMPMGQVLCEADGPLLYVYFPATAIVSLLYVLENGATSEIAGVGKEGVVGSSLFMDGHAPPGQAIVNAGGYGYRLKARVLMEEFNRGGATQHLLLRYIQALMTQISQTAACNLHHSVDQQLCRWLLLTLDRLLSNELTMTHERIASMLGVRREGITEAAGRLQQAGRIRYRRGHITVLDRPGLELYACECYGAIKNGFVRLSAEVQNRQATPFQASHANSSPWPLLLKQEERRVSVF